MPGLDTTASTVLRLAPRDWRRPLDWLAPLAAYVVGTDPGADTCLCLDAREPTLDPASVQAVVGRAVDYVAEGRSFAEILLIQDPIDLEALAEPIGDAAELTERLGLDVPGLAKAPRDVVRHAQWTKTLVDDLQATVDRALYDTTPAPAASDPLVSVRIPTYGAADLLIERAVPSVLAGTYGNVELLICSDGPQPHARAAVAAVDDPRVRYLELEERPLYPSRPLPFWQTAGTFAINRLLEAARGDYIAPLDHDDAFTADHVAALLQALRRERADFVYGQAMTEYANGGWGLLGRTPLAFGGIVHASVLYSRRLAHMRYDPHAWLIEEPGDWNLWRRMRDAGAQIAYLPAPVCLHFKEGSSMAGRTDDPATRLDAIANDVLETSARELLGVASRAWGADGLGRGGPRRAERGTARARLALVADRFPELGGAVADEAATLLELAPDTAVFAVQPLAVPWPRPIYPLDDFAGVCGVLGISDVHCRSLRLMVCLLGLTEHAGARGLGEIPADRGAAAALVAHGIRLHVTLDAAEAREADPALLEAIAQRAATIFAEAPMTLAVTCVPPPVEGSYFASRPRTRAGPLRVAIAGGQGQGLAVETALGALARLDERFALHIAGAVLGTANDPRVTAHGELTRPALRGLYWAADVFVAAGAETFPGSAAGAALASGCALVASNPGRDHAVLRPDEHYLEVQAGDSVELAAALDRLERDRDLRDALARRGAARIRETADAAVVARAKLAGMNLAE